MQARGKAIERSPVADGAAPHPEERRHRTIAAQLVDDLARRHGLDISRILNYVKSREREFFAAGGQGILAGMVRALPSEHTPQAIARRLIRTREALRLTPTEICRRAGLETNAYSNWEGGLRPGIDGAIALCLAFGLTLDWIYLGDPSGLPYELAVKLANPGDTPPPPRRRGRPRAAPLS